MGPCHRTSSYTWVCLLLLLLDSTGTRMPPRGKKGASRKVSSPTGAPPAQKQKRAPRPGQQPPAPRYGPRPRRDDGDAGDWEHNEPAAPAGNAEGSPEWAERKAREAHAWQGRLPKDAAAYRVAFPRVQRLRELKLQAVAGVMQAVVDEVFADHVCTVDAAVDAAGASASSSAAPEAACRTVRYVSHLGAVYLQVPTCTGCNAAVQPYDVGCAGWAPVLQAGWVDQDVLEDAHYSLVINGQSIDGEEDSWE